MKQKKTLLSGSSKNLKTTNNALKININYKT